MNPTRGRSVQPRPCPRGQSDRASEAEGSLPGIRVLIAVETVMIAVVLPDYIYFPPPIIMLNGGGKVRGSTVMGINVTRNNPRQ